MLHFSNICRKFDAGIKQNNNKQFLKNNKLQILSTKHFETLNEILILYHWRVLFVSRNRSSNTLSDIIKKHRYHPGIKLENYAKVSVPFIFECINFL